MAQHATILPLQKEGSKDLVKPLKETSASDRSSKQDVVQHAPGTCQQTGDDTANQKGRDHSGITPSYSFGEMPVYPRSTARIQPKLTINQPGDEHEREADAVADKIMQMSGRPSVRPSSSGAVMQPSQPLQRKCAHCEEEEEKEKPSLQRKPADGFVLQRKCAACEAEEKEEQLQRKASGEPGDGTASPAVRQTLQSPGQAMDGLTRSFMEQRFGYDFGKVRIHDDGLAHRSSSAIRAKAYTYRNHVVFGAGQYNPRTQMGKHLLAHELTHVVQQNGNTIQRQEIESTPPGSAEAGLAAHIVEDNVAPAPGQMRKSAFLRRLNDEVCTTVDRALRGTPYSSNNCPYIRSAFARHRNSSPFHLEQLLLRYEPSAMLARDAEGLIQIVLIRVEAAVNRWKQTGDLSTVPGEIAAQIRGQQGAVAPARAGSDFSFKANAGGAHATQSPAMALQTLGKGSALDSTSRGRMEQAFQTSFSHVEIHTDNQASTLSGNMNARAFTVGNHIAFGSGEYKPGTLVGDALLAHELAHVVQQGNVKKDETPHTQQGASEVSYEDDADFSAIRAVLSAWSGLKIGLKDIHKNAMPRLRSGLRLQRCVAAAAAPEAAALLIGGTETAAVVGGGTAVAGGITATDVLVGGLVIGTGGIVLEGDSPRPAPAPSASSTAAPTTGTTTAPTATTTPAPATGTSAATTAATAAAAAAAAELARRIAECEAIHRAYKALGNCRACKRTDTAAERAAKIACLTAVIAGRRNYLSKRCDYILPGSIARGSAIAERGHIIQAEQLEAMLANCSTLPTT